MEWLGLFGLSLCNGCRRLEPACLNGRQASSICGPQALEQRLGYPLAMSHCEMYLTEVSGLGFGGWMVLLSTGELFLLGAKSFAGAHRLPGINQLLLFLDRRHILNPRDLPVTVDCS